VSEGVTQRRQRQNGAQRAVQGDALVEGDHVAQDALPAAHNDTFNLANITTFWKTSVWIS